MSEENKAPLYLKFYKLIKELNTMVKNFPKHQKYALGDQMINLAWKCLDTVIETNNVSFYQKKAKLSELSVCFDKLKIRLRMAQELDLISVGQFSHLQIIYLNGTGNMIGGWIKWANNKNQNQ